MGSVTITASKVVLTLVKTAEVAEPMGYVAIDTNERSLDLAYSDGKLEKHDVSELQRIDHVYFEKRRSIQRKLHGDRRKSQKLQAKYRERGKHRTEQLMHRVGKAIVEKAKEKASE